MSWKTLKLQIYSRQCVPNVIRIDGFCGRYDKTFWCFFGSQCISIPRYVHRPITVWWWSSCVARRALTVCNAYQSELFVGPISSTQPSPTHTIVKIWTRDNPAQNPAKPITTTTNPFVIRKTTLGTRCHNNINITTANLSLELLPFRTYDPIYQK